MPTPVSPQPRLAAPERAPQMPPGLQAAQARRPCRPPSRVRPDQELALPIFVTVMILLYGCITAGAFCPAAAGRDEGWRQKQRMISVFETVVVLYTLWKATLTDPGQEAEGYVPAQQEEGTVNFCRRCERWKEPRTHHCSHCGRCVARYDHHCDWIDNCVGKGNHKFFVLFLWYVSTCCFHYFYMLWAYLWRRSAKETAGAGHANLGHILFTMFIVLYSILAAALLVFAVVFTWWTTHQMLRNQTTYEAEYLPGQPHNRGCFQNVQEVLGRNPLLWPVPIGTPVERSKARDLHL
eukprot:TRINITY_DN32960_c0_g1_i1.p2 TRINITY_DN32960_c0_g1~~TRINITY_DN32960_c0_g1_i1.p2  ORF type:complete len:316 (+),score=79.96 TRINITY_DN32960_c0_g1_i1:67-948(+)